MVATEISVKIFTKDISLNNENHNRDGALKISGLKKHNY